MNLLPDKEQNICDIDYEKNKMSSYRMNNIEALSERLKSLQITNETSSKTNKQTDKEMSMKVIPAVTNGNIQAVMLKSMVPDLG